MQNKIYIFLMTALIAAFAIVFNFFPRSTVSELEKRELATFPKFSMQKLTSGEFTDSVSVWFSDSEPYRDKLMALSMAIRANMALFKTDDAITFHAAEDGGTPWRMPRKSPTTSQATTVKSAYTKTS